MHRVRRRALIWMAVVAALAVMAFAIFYSPRCGENDKDSVKIGGTVLVAGCK